MKKRADIAERRENLLKFIRNNPNATYKSIRKCTKLHPERIFKSLEEAFRAAGINPPRTFKFKTKDERRRILIDYVKKNPNAGGHIIKRDTKINLLAVFANTKELFESAGIPYLREEKRNLMLRDMNEKREELINLIKHNPTIGIVEAGRIIRTHPYSLFKDINELYSCAGIKYYGKGAKRRAKKQFAVIEYVKNNPFATQREINNYCKTHVQLLFRKGIFEAYERAGVSFPFERLKLHGAAIKKIKDEARIFEEEIAKKLTGYGTVNRLVKTKRGFADIILERKGRKVVIELKNYKSHEISISQIKQLNRYLEDMGSNLGFLICLKKPKKDTFLIGKNMIYVILESELSKISDIADL